MEGRKDLVLAENKFPTSIVYQTVAVCLINIFIYGRQLTNKAIVKVLVNKCCISTCQSDILRSVINI